MKVPEHATKKKISYSYLVSSIKQSKNKAVKNCSLLKFMQYTNREGC